MWSGVVWSEICIAMMNWFPYTQGLMGPLMIRIAFMPIYILADNCEMSSVYTDEKWKEQYSAWTEFAILSHDPGA